MSKDRGVISALLTICFYQSYEEFVKKIIDELKLRIENQDKNYGYLQLPKGYEWGSEQHTLFMTLVNEYGTWGSSIRGGWIENEKGLLDDIEYVIKEEWGDLEKYLTGDC